MCQTMYMQCCTKKCLRMMLIMVHSMPRYCHYTKCNVEYHDVSSSGWARQQLIFFFATRWGAWIHALSCIQNLRRCHILGGLYTWACVGWTISNTLMCLSFVRRDRATASLPSNKTSLNRGLLCTRLAGGYHVWERPLPIALLSPL